ncbi:MAG: DegT/DnrJ/EryC1/StrS family aminotransferase [bacterium]
MIPPLDLKAQYALLEAPIRAAIEQVMQETSFVLGPAVRDLEKRVAQFCECKHGVGVASGTDALRLAMAAIELKPGDEVITTPFTFIATANTVSHTGAKPVFVDIDPKTYNMDLAAVEKAITTKTKAIVPVHLFGHPVDMDPLIEQAKIDNLFVIEDCAQAIGARYKGKRVGSFGEYGCFSFYPTKNLGAYGDGGMVVSNDTELADRIDVLRRQGSKRKYHADVLGFNSRLDSIQAAILGVKLNHLEEWNRKRRQVAQKYNELLRDTPVVTPYEAPNIEHVYHQYTIRADQRDQLAEFLKENGVGTMVYYPIPIHLQTIYKDLGYKEGSLPHSEKAAKEVLSLPMYPELTDEQIETVAGAIRKFYS